MQTNIHQDTNLLLKIKVIAFGTLNPEQKECLVLCVMVSVYKQLQYCYMLVRSFLRYATMQMSWLFAVFIDNENALNDIAIVSNNADG
jgi:hypothetical protein